MKVIINRIYCLLTDFFSFQQKTSKETRFLAYNTRLMLQRLHVASIGIIIFYSYFLYLDLILLKDLDNYTFRIILFAIHLFCFVISVLYLLLYRAYRKKQWFVSGKKRSLLINSYLFMYIFIGAATSLNSQSLTGNIDAYLIIMVAVAVFFPIEPKYFFPIIISNHFFFLLLLPAINASQYYVVTKEVNSTISAVLALLVNATFFSNKRKNFLNQLQLKENEAAFKKMFDINPFPLLLTNVSSGCIVMMNKAAQQFLEISEEAMKELRPEKIFNNDEEWQKMKVALGDDKSLKDYIVKKKHSDGSLKWLLLNITVVYYEQGEHFLVAVNDVTEFKTIENELEIQASIDTLTGVMNRGNGLKMLRNKLLAAKKELVEFTICFIDINNLKVVNDTYGHFEGDHFIKTICNVIIAQITTKDVLFRYGGDEFVIVFNFKDEREAEEIWRKITRGFEAINNLKENRYQISASHGLFYFKSGMEVTVEEMLEYADANMYQEKSHLRNN